MRLYILLIVYSIMCLPHYFYTSCKELKHVKKLMEHGQGLMDKVREQAEGVMEKNGHSAGYIST